MPSKISIKREDGAVVNNRLALTEGEKAAHILTAFARAGGSPGQKFIVSCRQPPNPGEVSVDYTGNILFSTADAVTDAEVVYVVAEGRPLEAAVNVSAAGAATLSHAGILLLSAQLLTGTTPGNKSVQCRGEAPGAGQASLSANGSVVSFKASEVGGAGGKAKIRYLARP